MSDDMIVYPTPSTTYRFTPGAGMLVGLMMPVPERATDNLYLPPGAHERLSQGQSEQAPILHVLAKGRNVPEHIQIGKNYLFAPRTANHDNGVAVVSMPMQPAAMFGLDQSVWLVHCLLVVAEVEVYDHDVPRVPAVPKALLPFGAVENQNGDQE